MDCVLGPTKQKVLEEQKRRQGTDLNPEPFLYRAAGVNFFNTFPMDLKAILGDQGNIAQNLLAYLHAFSPNVSDIFERFELPGQIDRLAKAELLYLVTENSATPISTPTRFQVPIWAASLNS